MTSGKLAGFAATGQRSDRRTVAAWGVALVAVAAVAAVAVVALRAGAAPATTTGSGSSAIVATYGVGGVLKSNGNLYQWRPESRKWVTIDESFRLDGETRRVLPLPVPAGEVARMEGFGFIVTRSGVCWLYNLDSNTWENIGRP